MYTSTLREHLVKFASRGHPPQSLDALVHRHLRALSVLQFQFLVLLAAFGGIVVNPFKRIRHVVFLLGQARTIADSVGDQSTVRLPEIDLYAEWPVNSIKASNQDLAKQFLGVYHRPGCGSEGKETRARSRAVLVARNTLLPLLTTQSGKYLVYTHKLDMDIPWSGSSSYRLP